MLFTPKQYLKDIETLQFISPINGEKVIKPFSLVMGNENMGIKHIVLKHGEEGFVKSLPKFFSVIKGYQPIADFDLKNSPLVPLQDKLLYDIPPFVYVVTLAQTETELTYLQTAFRPKNSYIKRLRTANLLYKLEKGL